jgi:hypothetical protein
MQTREMKTIAVYAFKKSIIMITHSNMKSKEDFQNSHLAVQISCTKKHGLFSTLAPHLCKKYQHI